MTMLLKKVAACALLALGILTIQTLPALACGGLIAPDGDVRLDRAATLIAWHDGIEHYMTSFAYEGTASSLGWIVPLPSAPISPIVEGGAWTLQRLDREVHPPPPDTFTDAPVAAHWRRSPRWRLPLQRFLEGDALRGPAAVRSMRRPPQSG